MKETGFPSLFIDIMMLRPEARTSHTAFWPAASGTFTTLLGWPRSPISSSRRSRRRRFSAWSSSANSTSSSASGLPRT